MEKPKKFTLNRDAIKKLQDEALENVVGAAAKEPVKSIIVFETPGAAGRYSCFASDCC